MLISDGKNVNHFLRKIWNFIKKALFLKHDIITFAKKYVLKTLLQKGELLNLKVVLKQGKENSELNMYLNMFNFEYLYQWFLQEAKI